MPIKDIQVRKKYQKQYWKNYTRRTTPEFKEQVKRISIKQNREIRLSMFEILGGAYCKRCGFSDIRALQVDHINGCGTKNRKIGFYLLKEIKDSPHKFQILCANCNWIKRTENGELRHKI